MANNNRPKNIRVEYSVEATINLGNFENIRPGYRISAEVPEGSNTREVRAQLKALADGWLEEDFEAIRAEARG